LPPAQPAFIWYPPGPSTRFPEIGSGARSAMAGPVYHFDAELKSARKFPAEYDGALFIFDWERSWIGLARLDSEGRLEKLRTFAPEIRVKRPISMAFGPDGALYVIQWGTAWYNNKDSELARIDYENSPAIAQ
jgi:cytochrome c